MAERKKPTRPTEEAEVQEKAAASKQEAATEEAKSKAAEDAPEPEAKTEDKPKRSRRRGSAETTARAEPRREAPKRPDGAIVVRARARYVRSAPRKARLVMDHIRGRPVEQAMAMLTHTPRAASTDILKLLRSATANAEANYELGADELKIDRAYVDEGPTIKRYRPRAYGRATKILKRTSHMTIELTTAGKE
jgi:large subunit ribosomal protein L22